MYNKKVLIESLKKLGSAKAPTQKKDIIMNSVRGQWDNPGDITQVPGSKITMGPDPLTGKPLTQPLLGVGSNGQRQMMYPGKDYDFGDAEYVTEYPQMRSGGNKQNHVVVKKSNIQGNGLFINEPIRKGDIIGLAHINNQATPIVGKNHNHSENNPTAVTISQGNKRYLVASKDLPAGTEITTNYRLQPELEQPEDFMKNGGMTPTFKKGGGPGDRWLASLVKQGTRSNYNPLVYPVKLAGERIARQSATASRTKQQILDAFFDKNYASKPKYFGNQISQNKHNNSVYGYGKRDLIANYFRGIDTGFEPIDYDFDRDAGLEALINEYGPLKAYLMNSEIQHGEPLHAFDLQQKNGISNMEILDPDIFANWTPAYSNQLMAEMNHDYLNKGLPLPTWADEAISGNAKESYHKLFDLYGKEIIPFDINYDMSKPQPLFSFRNSPVDPIDDVGGHMSFLERTPQNEFQLTTRDSWGFVPKSYNPKWDMREKFKQRQSQLMDIFGKPFILTQTNPITFKKGGVHKTKNKNSRSYSRSLDATNKFFAENYLFEKPSSRKNKIYDPHAKYYQKGGASSPEAWGQEIKDLESQIGNPDSWTLEDYYLLQDKLNDYRNWRETTPEGQAVNDSHNEEGEYNIPLPEHLRNYTNAVMKSKLAYANEFGNPAAKRMINLPDNPYQFDNGDTGTHYMASMDNYAVPQIQDENGQLNLGDYGPSSTEAMRFDNPNDARYFAEHYKDVAPGFINAKLSPEEIQEYAKGGYIIEDISVPELDKAQYGIETIGKAIKGAGKLLSNTYKINPWATKIVDPLSKIIGEGKNAFIYDPSFPQYQRIYKAKPNMITGYTKIKKPNQLDFSPIIEPKTKAIEEDALKTFKMLERGKGNDLNLEQFVDYFEAQQKRELLKYHYQNFLTDINREKFYDTPEWANTWQNSYDKTDDVFKKIEERIKEKQKNSPLGMKIGSGAEGDVYELIDDPAHVIKIGQTFKTESAEDLVNSFEGITDDNIARVLRAHKKDNSLIEVMHNLNKTGTFNNFTKDEVIRKLEKDVKVLLDRGFYLDTDNLNGNFKYNHKKNKIDIYDISKPSGKTYLEPEHVFNYLKNNLNAIHHIPEIHPLYDLNKPTPEFQKGGEQTVTDTDKDYYTRMANSPLFVERYARMVGKPIDQVGEEAEAYRQQILNNIETVKINDVGVYPDKVTKRKQSKSIEGVYYPPVEIEKEEIDEIQKNINEAPEFRRKHLQKNFDETVAKLTAPNHNLFLYGDDPWARTHELSHASVKGNINDKNVNAYSFQDLSEYPTLDKYYNSNKKYLKYFDGRKEYLTSPDEQKARVDVARKYLESKGLYDPVNENFTPQHYKNYLMELEKSNNDVPHDIDEITTPYDVETTIKMFNDFVEKEPTQNSNLVKAEQGGSTDYELGDTVDKATMERLKKLGYTFETI